MSVLDVGSVEICRGDARVPGVFLQPTVQRQEQGSMPASGHERV
jgi:hypothetical protein